MGIFFEKIDEKKYWHYKQKISFKQSLIFPILLFIIIPLIGMIFKNLIILIGSAILFLAILIIAIWFGVEAVYYKSIIPQKAIKEGKKIIFLKNVQEGIKIEK